MGLLESNKKKDNQNKDVTATTRITSSEYDRFKALCDETGYSISEAIRVLIQNELNPKKTVSSSPRTVDRVEKVQQPRTDAPKPVVQDEGVPNDYNIPPKIYNPTFRRNGSKFTTNEWKIDEFLPCPICKEWTSATNFSRHAKTIHGMTTQEIFIQFKEEADRMVEEKKQELGV